MHHIHGQKAIVLFVFMLLVSPIWSQIGGKGNYNFSRFNKKSYYFGINLGFNDSGYTIYNSKNFINNDSIRVTGGSNKVGVNMHMITNLKLGDFFDFRFLPGFSFANRGFLFTQVSDNKVVERNIESVFFEMPFHIRFKSEPYKDKRLFVMAGLKYSYDVQTSSKARSTILRIAPHDFQYEIGIGLQMFYPYFIFSPEIKFSRGINNLLLSNSAQNEAKVLENVISEIFTISFNFEG